MWSSWMGYERPCLYRMCAIKKALGGKHDPLGFALALEMSLGSYVRAVTLQFSNPDPTCSLTGVASCSFTYRSYRKTEKTEPGTS